MNDVVILGASGLAREVAQVIRARNQAEPMWNLLGFLDRDPVRWGTEFNGLPILGDDDWWQSHPSTLLVCAIGSARIRKTLTDSLASAGAHFCSVIHPSVEIPTDVSIGEGTVIMAGARFSANARVGAHVTLYLNCSITHDVTIGDCSLIASNCSLAGGAVIGTAVELGTSACVLPTRRVGDWSIIGAGSVVNRDIPSAVVAAGVPCRVLRPIEISDRHR